MSPVAATAKSLQRECATLPPIPGEGSVSDDGKQAVRLDKWLWAARFFKTRSLAQTAVNGGKVHLNGARTRPAKPLRVDDTLCITKGQVEFEVQVRALSERRGKATDAQALYEETPESVARREAIRAARKESRSAGPERRPDKRDRRKLRDLGRGDTFPR